MQQGHQNTNNSESDIVQFSLVPQYSQTDHAMSTSGGYVLGSPMSGSSQHLSGYVTPATQVDDLCYFATNAQPAPLHMQLAQQQQHHQVRQSPQNVGASMMYPNAFGSNSPSHYPPHPGYQSTAYSMMPSQATLTQSMLTNHAAALLAASRQAMASPSTSSPPLSSSPRSYDSHDLQFLLSKSTSSSLPARGLQAAEMAPPHRLNGTSSSLPGSSSNTNQGGATPPLASGSSSAGSPPPNSVVEANRRSSSSTNRMHPCMWCFLAEPQYYTAMDSKYSFCERHRNITAKQPVCCIKASTGRMLLCPVDIIKEMQEHGAVERRIYGTKQLPGRFIIVPRHQFKIMALRYSEDVRKRKADEAMGESGEREVLCFRNRLQRNQFLELVREVHRGATDIKEFGQLGINDVYLAFKPRVRHRDFNHSVHTERQTDGAFYDLHNETNQDMDKPSTPPPDGTDNEPTQRSSPLSSLNLASSSTSSSKMPNLTGTRASIHDYGSYDMSSRSP